MHMDDKYENDDDGWKRMKTYLDAWFFCILFFLIFLFYVVVVEIHSLNITNFEFDGRLASLLNSLMTLTLRNLRLGNDEYCNNEYLFDILHELSDVYEPRSLQTSAEFFQIELSRVYIQTYTFRLSEMGIRCHSESDLGFVLTQLYSMRVMSNAPLMFT